MARRMTKNRAKIEHNFNIESTTKQERKKKSGFQEGAPRPPRKSDRWQGNNEECFYAWLEDIQPRILTRKRVYEVFQPTEDQKVLISQVFATDGELLKHNLVLSIQPRRHGKSTLMALIALFMFTARRNYTIALLGNTDAHSNRTQFRLIENIIRHTSELKSRIDLDKDMRLDSIRKQSWGNTILRSGTTLQTSFGDRLNLLWVSDLHATNDPSVFNALQASLLDSEDSLVLIDSNVDEVGGVVHELEQQAKEDESMFCQRIEYVDFDEYTQKAPQWIDRKRAKRLQKTLLPAEFDRDILGKRTNLINQLFYPIVIERCTGKYQMPVQDIQNLTNGREYKIGGGLDRAKNLLAGPDSDRSVWTTILKIADPATREPEFYILNQVRFIVNSSRHIKSSILEDHERYHLDHAALENYETVDLLPYLVEQGIETELITATSTAQNASFPELHRIAREGRLHIPKNCTELTKEMATFVYKRRSGFSGDYQFGHSSQKFHDDTVYSLNWAIYSLRNWIPEIYSLSSIVCGQKQAVKRALCFLMGGNMVMHCASTCPAYHEVVAMYCAYKQLAMDAEDSIQEFYSRYVRNRGLVQYQLL